MRVVVRESLKSPCPSYILVCSSDHVHMCQCEEVSKRSNCVPTLTYACKGTDYKGKISEQYCLRARVSVPTPDPTPGGDYKGWAF